jgi:hypothetical protein
MFYFDLDSRKLMKLHDELNHALGVVYDALDKSGAEAPAWLALAAQDVQDWYAELWSRRKAERPSDDADPTPAP